MACYLLSESAQNDVVSIRNYTRETWGKTQAEKYLSHLEQRLEWLAQNPFLGRRRDEIKKGYFSFPEGRHIIFYRATERGIEVMGVIHQSEDIDFTLVEGVLWDRNNGDSLLNTKR